MNNCACLCEQENDVSPEEKRKAFDMAVLAGAICRQIQRGGGSNIAEVVMIKAALVQMEDLPDDPQGLWEAVGAFLDYEYQTRQNPQPRPDFLNTEL